MARPYSKKFLDELYEADIRQIGVQLGRLCVKCNIPATYVAKALGVSRITVYSWFRGQDIRARKRKEVEVMIDLMQKDLTEHVLPAKTMTDAKTYIEGLVGIKL